MDHSGGLTDRDVAGPASVLVVHAAHKRPVDCAAGNVGQHVAREAGARRCAAHIDSCNRRRYTMWVRIVSAAVIVDDDPGIGLADAIGDRGIADVVVVGGAGEGPVISGIRTGVGVGRVAYVNATDRGSGLTVHTGDRRISRRVRVAVIGSGRVSVGRDRDRSAGLGDAIVHRAAVIVVVASA